MFAGRVNLDQKARWLPICLIDVDGARSSRGHEIPATAQNHGDPERRKRDLIGSFEEQQVPSRGTLGRCFTRRLWPVCIHSGILFDSWPYKTSQLGFFTGLVDKSPK